MSFEVDIASLQSEIETLAGYIVDALHYVHIGADYEAEKILQHADDVVSQALNLVHDVYSEVSYKTDDALSRISNSLYDIYQRLRTDLSSIKTSVNKISNTFLDYFNFVRTQSSSNLDDINMLIESVITESFDTINLSLQQSITEFYSNITLFQEQIMNTFNTALQTLNERYTMIEGMALGAIHQAELQIIQSFDNVISHIDSMIQDLNVWDSENWSDIAKAMRNISSIEEDEVKEAIKIFLKAQEEITNEILKEKFEKLTLQTFQS